MFMQQEGQKKILELFGKLHGNRERLLAALLPNLDPATTVYLVDSVLHLPEDQRVGPMFILMPDLSDELKTKMYQNILTMRSAFGRTWLLWHMSEYFSDEQ